jgi:hypothetical protein
MANREGLYQCPGFNRTEADYIKEGGLAGGSSYDRPRNCEHYWTLANPDEIGI